MAIQEFALFKLIKAGTFSPTSFTLSIHTFLLNNYYSD